MTDSDGLDRRRLLSTLGAVGATAAAGCLEQLRSTVGREPLQQVELTVKTVPADTDEAAVRIARELAKNLESVGADADVLPLAEEELLRDVLVNADFDLYVARYPARRDADFIRAALHSGFVEEPGWQNPFGYANIAVDELLVEQRRAPPGAREEVLGSIQRAFVRDCPFAVVAFPDEPHATRTDRFAGWFDADTHSKLGYLSLRRIDDGDGGTDDGEGDGGADDGGNSEGGDGGDGDGSTESPEALRIGITDGRPTRNRNPLAVEFRDRGVVTNLLYDSLGHRLDGEVEPWLARSWTWEVDDDRPVVDIDIREGVRWHDGTALTADDVAFTYRFLADTSLGDGSMAVPSPRYRGQVSLVESVERLGERSVRLRFVPASRMVAARALTVPVLPEYVWRARAVPANIAGLPLSEYATEALVSNNPQPVGSGPFRFERAAADELLSLRRFEDHFLHHGDLGESLAPFANRPAFDALRFEIVPSAGAALELLADGKLDATAAPLSPGDVPKVGRSSDLRLSVDTMDAFYHVGFNARRQPLGNPRFRHVVARLLDREHVAATVLGGYATAATSPLTRTEQAYSLSDAVPDDRLAFPGSDGELDAGRAIELFREAGYSYRDGKLLMH
jgi:peptide/nickel transport system substrate-binding protein